MSSEAVTDQDYARLLELRTGLRRFLKWSADRAAEQGLTPAQHQLMLAVRGHVGDRSPSIAVLAEHLQLRHHSTVELVDRAEREGLVARRADPDDARLTLVELTEEGSRRLEALSGQHIKELDRLAPRMAKLWAEL